MTRELYYRLVMQLTGYEFGPQGSLDTTFAALADPTRRAILARLAEGERTVSELAEPFALSQPAISKHLKVLERARLISRDRDAQRRPSRLEAAPLAEASHWLERYREFWQTSFHRLDALLSSLQQIEPASKNRRGASRSRKTTSSAGAARRSADLRSSTVSSGDTNDSRARQAKAPGTRANRGTRSRGK